MGTIYKGSSVKNGTGLVRCRKSDLGERWKEIKNIQTREKKNQDKMWKWSSMVKGIQRKDLKSFLCLPFLGQGRIKQRLKSNIRKCFYHWRFFKKGWTNICHKWHNWPCLYERRWNTWPLGALVSHIFFDFSKKKNIFLPLKDTRTNAPKAIVISL